MNFEVLEKFEWYNDPENVRFDIDAMTVYAKSDTDFWQSVHRGYKKDNGHFFFCRHNNISLDFKCKSVIRYVTAYLCRAYQHILVKRISVV